MGDRANVVVREKDILDPPVFLYTHWGGSSLPLHLQDALDRGKSRWDDCSYLARIIFCSMIPEEQHHELTSFGISTTLTDNEYPLLVVDCDEQKVKMVNDLNKPDASDKQWTFEEFCHLDLSNGWNVLINS